MGQSNYIAASILIAFFVYITAKGSLPKYIEFMTASGGFSSDTANAATVKQTDSAFDKDGGAVGEGQGGGGGGGSSATAGSGTTGNSAGNVGGDADKSPLSSIGSVLGTAGDASKLLDAVEMFGGGGW